MHGTSTSRKGSALALVLLTASCISQAPSASSVKPPPPLIPAPTAAGVPSGEPESKTIGSDGGTFSSSDGRIVVAVPAGTVSGPTAFSVTPISNRAPGGVGQAFRLEAASPLASTVTITFKGLSTYPAGASVASLSIATQDAGGFWHTADAVTRDSGANTVSATVSHFSDWALVWTQGTPALRGTFTLNQSFGTPFSATGEGTLYLRTDVSTTEPWYVFTGTITIPPQINIGSSICTPVAPTQTLSPNTAEVHAAQFRWGLNARWELSCTNALGGAYSDELVTLFDTLRINLACPGGYVGTQVNGPEFIQGAYTSDCGVTGTVSASWDFRACTAGAACQTADPCRTGVISCAGPLPACVENGNAPDGTTCGADSVCSAGACVGCVAGSECTPTNACHTGTLSCSAGPVCNDTLTPVADGTSCGIDAVCGGGVCNPCVVGESCVSADLCRTAALTCNTGFPVCTNTGLEPDGTSCGTNLVCSGGACVSCSAGTACTPQNPCHGGVLSCSAGPVCNDDATVLADGTSCGPDAVCGGGTCNACVAGASCPPSSACRTAVVTCNTGFPVCGESGNQPDGTTCGTDLVCDEGACVGCVAGSACTPANPCHVGTLSCSAGPVCNDTGAPVTDGTSCGIDAVCGGGVCTACTSGQQCSPPANVCRTGAIACSSGAPVCTETGNVADGTDCGTGLVCDEGACVACAAGSACVPANPCHTGTLSCSTGPVCSDAGGLVGAGISCGVDAVCDGSGTCTPCTSGQVCLPSNPCKTGAIACGSGSPVCAETGNVADGTSCGTGGVCGGGVCNACAPGTPCGTNPNSCVAGVVDCSTGFAVCLDTTTPIANGTTCGTNQVCNGGVCSGCEAGVACSTNPNECYAGVTSCATGSQTCVDNTAAPDPVATLCSGGVCNGAGVCNPCTAGNSCSTNPNECYAGVTSCATGSQTCVNDTSSPDPVSTPCTGGVCDGAGACSACTAGLSCSTNPNECYAGVTSCATGTQTCVDNTAAPDPVATACTGGVCNGAGVCNTCTSGEICTPSTECRTGAIACDSGAPVCTETGNVPDLTPCSIGVCTGGVCGS